MDPERINNIDIEKRLTSLKTAASKSDMAFLFMKSLISVSGNLLYHNSSNSSLKSFAPVLLSYDLSFLIFKSFLFHRKFNTVADTESNFFVIRYCNFRKINLIVSLFLDVL